MIIEIETLPNVSPIRVKGFPNLDPIQIILQPRGPGQTHVIVECYGEAWAAFFQHGQDVEILNFIASLDHDYLAGKFTTDRERKSSKNRMYLERICRAVIETAKQAF